MDILIWIVLTICSIFFTILMLAVEDYIEIKGFGLVIAIVCLIFWLVTGLSAINLTNTFVTIYDTSVTEHVVTYSDTWPIALFFVLAGIFPFLIILKKVPETWDVEER